MAGMVRFASGEHRVNREELVDWARSRFETEDLSSSTISRTSSTTKSMRCSSAIARSIATWRPANNRKSATKLTPSSVITTIRTLDEASGGNGAISSLSKWLEDTLNYKVEEEEIKSLDKTQLERKLIGAVDDHYRPEMRRMERAMLLHIVDGAWKDHLLAMDYLKSSVSLVGYAQVDPKVEYKREGMKTIRINVGFDRSTARRT